MTEPIYLDYNATTPIDPGVVEAMLPYLYQHFGNPSSSHIYGQRTHRAVEEARVSVASLLGCLPEEIVFTSGGSESNNHAIQGVAHSCRAVGRHIITSAIEHPAVTQVCDWLATQGYSITYIPVDREGLVDPAAIEQAITEQTILVSIMHANNEVGTLQPISEISKIVRKRHILFHTDCAQSIGKVPVNVADLGVDLLTLAGHKLYAPKGVGALYIRKGISLPRLIHGASHESNRRAGTENVASLVGLGVACRLVQQLLPQESIHLKPLRDQLETKLQEAFPQMRINGSRPHRLPNTASLSFPGLRAQDILQAMASDVVASAGAACHSDGVAISHVLQAMNIPTHQATGTVRFSLGRTTTPQQIEQATSTIISVVRNLYAQNLTPESQNHMLMKE